MPTYDEIKTELAEIAKILDKYPSAVQPQVYELLISNFLGRTPVRSFESRPSTGAKKSSGGKKQRKKAKGKESLSILKDLNLRGDEKVPAFKQFYQDKKPESNIQFNALAVYYLIHHLKLSSVTPNHIYTCYREVGRRSPTAFIQSLRDTSSSRFGYIDGADMNNIKIPLRGMNFVEHDLPPKIKKHEQE